MYTMKYVGEHVEVFNRFTGEFILSADAEQEAEHELKEGG
jgi:hypothetical protein